MTPLPCPFCGEKPVLAPEDPAVEGNAWGMVKCENKRCVTYDKVFGHGVHVSDGALSCDSRGSTAYKNAAIRRWNRRK